ncbi:unnamed protein product [Microthlaspi erraticum]|uniref:RING-type E3 ubiquitin transferase n=1 Tax=Microthlaspi erraticum TaxID=1685480 RepID=A0A6D2JLE3_9BRAS|nr:unnamed protein product [Microthlaspi erraticum]
MVNLERKIRLLVQSTAYESGQTMVQQESQTNESDLAILIVTVIIFLIFAVGLTSVCFRWSTYDTLNQLRDTLRPVSRARSDTTEARGVDEAIVKSFPTFLYSEVKERRIGTGGAECVVCLCEFEDDETLRLMPNCCHVFHADCVSVWLRNHSTCPLCRVDLVLQTGEGSELVTDPDSTDANLFEGMTWTNRNRPPRSWSMRLSQCRVSEFLFSRSNSTGHCAIQLVETVDRFKLRLPEDIQRELAKKTVDQVALTQEKSLPRGYRSKSAGSERRSVMSDNKRKLQSASFSFYDRVASTSDGGCAAKSLQPDDLV